MELAAVLICRAGLQGCFAGEEFGSIYLKLAGSTQKKEN